MRALQDTSFSARSNKSLRYKLNYNQIRENNNNHNHNYNHNNSALRMRADVCFSKLSIDVESISKNENGNHCVTLDLSIS